MGVYAENEKTVSRTFGLKVIEGERDILIIISRIINIAITRITRTVANLLYKEKLLVFLSPHHVCLDMLGTPGSTAWWKVLFPGVSYLPVKQKQLAKSNSN